MREQETRPHLIHELRIDDPPAFVPEGFSFDQDDRIRHKACPYKSNTR